MSFLRYLYAAILLPGALCAAEVDWTPRLTTVEAEGTTLTRLCFAAGEHRFALSLDLESQPEAANGGTKFTFKKVPSGAFVIRPSPVKVALPARPNQLDEYHKAALALAPAGATDFSDLEDALDPLAINQWKSYRLTFSYNYFGKRTRHSVTFLTLETGQQAVLETSAYEKEFAETMVRSDRLIRSWHELPEEKPGKVARLGGN